MSRHGGVVSALFTALLGSGTAAGTFLTASLRLTFTLGMALVQAHAEEKGASLFQQGGAGFLSGATRRVGGGSALSGFGGTLRVRPGLLVCSLAHYSIPRSILYR
ncbi:Uncharacterised protein [Mycobacterium tuberculosis]|nr:Uncharacterised protein [Mycobacterium tuberculosis]